MNLNLNLAISTEEDFYSAIKWCLYMEVPVYSSTKADYEKQKHTPKHYNHLTVSTESVSVCRADGRVEKLVNLDTWKANILEYFDIKAKKVELYPIY
jgi:hypothetical protein